MHMLTFVQIDVVATMRPTVKLNNHIVKENKLYKMNINININMYIYISIHIFHIDVKIVISTVHLLFIDPKFMVGTSNERRIRGCKGQARAIDQVAMRADLKAQHPLRDGIRDGSAAEKNH